MTLLLFLSLFTLVRSNDAEPKNSYPFADVVDWENESKREQFEIHLKRAGITIAPIPMEQLGLAPQLAKEQKCIEFDKTFDAETRTRVGYGAFFDHFFVSAFSKHPRKNGRIEIELRRIEVISDLEGNTIMLVSYEVKLDWFKKFMASLMGYTSEAERAIFREGDLGEGYILDASSQDLMKKLFRLTQECGTLLDRPQNPVLLQSQNGISIIRAPLAYPYSFGMVGVVLWREIDMSRKGLMVPKKIAESAIEYYPYTIFPNDLNALDTAFGGRVFAVADHLAGVVAQRHSNRICVTLLTDSVRFRAPARKGETLVFKAALNRAWGSSMEVGIKVLAENFLTGETKHVFSAYFTFVAVDTKLQPVRVRPVIPESDEEKRRFEAADLRRKQRLELEARLNKTED